MPHDPAPVLAERLLILTLALAQTEDQPEIDALLDERQRTLDALADAEPTPALMSKLTQVMQAERAALQRFAEVRAQAVRSIDRSRAGRRLPSTYARPGVSSRLFDGAS